MTKIQVSDSWPALKLTDIERVEHDLGVRFPENYRHFLLAHNGGRLSPEVFPIHGNPNDDSSAVNWLYCIHNGDEYDLLYNAAIFKGRMPRELLPIGEDPYGNQICLAIGGDAKGAIYFWDHEDESDDDEEVTYRNVFFVAASFKEFLNSLHEHVET